MRDLGDILPRKQGDSMHALPSDDLFDHPLFDRPLSFIHPSNSYFIHLIPLFHPTFQLSVLKIQQALIREGPPEFNV